MKIIKTIVIVSAIAFFLPSPPDGGKKPGPASPELMSAAVSAAGDMGGFCMRQPAVCSTAMSLAGTLEAKARYSVKLLYEWAIGAPQTGSTGPAPEIEAPAKSPAQIGGQSENANFAETLAADASSQNTLRLEDIIPEWRDPRAVKRG